MTIAHEVRGSGPAVLLVHEGVADRRMWRHQIPVLEPNHTVVAVDLRGFGETPHASGPFSHVEDLGLRKVTRNGEVGRVVDFLSQGRCRRQQDWKDRFKENTEKMRTGSLLAVAEVLKTLLAGACVPIVIVWSAFAAVTSSVFSGAAL